MKRDFIAELRDARTQTSANYAYAEMENELSPIELAALRPQLAALPARVKLLVANSDILRVFETEAPRAFVTSELCDGARLFTGLPVDRAKKSLLIVFAGLTERPMIPCSLFLQMLPDQGFDVLMLADRSQALFADGIAGVRLAFTQMVAEVAQRAGIGDYAKVYTFGTSVGGLPALRAGRQLGVSRAIAIGPLFPWLINRLEAKGRPHIAAFDPLCVCSNKGAVEYVAALAGGNERDMKSARLLERIMPTRLDIYPEFTAHNLIYSLYGEGRLRGFLGDLFDFDAGQKLTVRKSPLWLRAGRRVRGVLRRAMGRMRGEKKMQRFRPAEPLDREPPNF